MYLAPISESLSRRADTHSFEYGPGLYSVPVSRQASVMLGLMTSAFEHSPFMYPGNSGENTEYSSPLSAIAGSTRTSVSLERRLSMRSQVMSICSLLHMNPVKMESNLSSSLFQWAAMGFISSVRSLNVNPGMPVCAERMAFGMTVHS